MKTGIMYTRLRSTVPLFLLAVAALLIGVDTALAQTSELERLQQCDRDLCDILRAPADSGKPLQCDLSRTWYKEQIDKATRSKGVPWLLGDARCTLKLDIGRAVLSRAISEENYRLKVPEQPARCEIEYRQERYPVAFTFAPEFEFRDGQAISVSLGIKNIKANPLVTALMWSVTKLQDSLGLYEDDVLREVNRYIERQCRARPNGRRQVKLEGMLVR